jgi:hypothetical protein
MSGKEENLSELEKLHKKTKNVAMATLSLFLIGMMMVAATVVFGISWSNIMQNDHLENPKMPLDQYPENATYIWTQKEIMKEVYTLIPIGLIGISTAVIAFGLLYLLPDKKDFHKLKCKISGVKDIQNLGLAAMTEWKYCPECGLKLSDLEPKKKHNN